MASLEAPGKPPAISKRFEVESVRFKFHYRIKSTDGGPQYFVHIALYKPNTPDITIHAGADTKAPVVAVSHMSRISSELKIGLGDPAEPAAMKWEDVAKQTVTASHYSVSASIPNGTGGYQRSTFSWKRTHSVGVDGANPSALSRKNHKLVEDATGEVVAVFTSVKSLTKCGTLQINVEYGQDFDTMVLISCISLYEKVRRRNRRTA